MCPAVPHPKQTGGGFFFFPLELAAAFPALLLLEGAALAAVVLDSAARAIRVLAHWFFRCPTPPQAQQTPLPEKFGPNDDLDELPVLLAKALE